MRAPALSVDQLASLPVVYRAMIPHAYEDRQDHMNMRWYLALYDEAGDAMYPMLGLTADYFAWSGAGSFDLEHHLWYPSEVRIGDARPELEAFPLHDVHGKRDTGRALLAFRVRARSCRPQNQTHRPPPGPGGGPDRRPHRRTRFADLAGAGFGFHGP